VNDAKPGHVLARIRAQVAPGAAVACLGLAFKANVDDLRESPALDIAVHLTAEGYRVLAVEPHITTLPTVLAGRAELVDLAAALARADAVVLLVDHRAFASLTLADLAGKALIDTRGQIR
jgi:UDP-N-acetyl-D-mannosaminuronic acid dehydrogenase